MIDIWVVEARLGGGGMGTVYRCHNRDATRIQAAIKVLDTRLADSGEVRRRFVREAELLFELDHPHIVKVRNIRMDAEPPFIEMAFVKGTSLRNWIHQGPMAPGAAARVIGQIASALNHCHSREVRHRDVKPDNILLSGSHATLVDFGIAAEANGTLTNGSGTVGTLSYTPPEWGDLDADSRLWDTYGLGVVFYELLTGEMAFPARKGKSLRQEIVRIISQKQKIAWLDPGDGHPEELRALIRQLTATAPADRPTDLQEVADQLVQFTVGRDDLELEDLVLEEDSVTVEFSTAGSAQDGGVGGGAESPSSASSDTFAEYGITPPVVDSSDRLSTVSEGPPPRSAGVSWVRVGGVVAVLAAVGFGLLQGFFGSAPETRMVGSRAAVQFRPVEIVRRGDSHNLPVEFRVDGKTVDLDAPLTLHVDEHQLEARLGSDCAEPPSTECLTTIRTVGVVAGVGSQRLRATLPELRELSLQFDPALPEGAEVRIDDGDWIPPDGATVRGGIESTVTAKVGVCPGATCRQASIPLTPPLNPDGPVVASLELPQKRDRTAPQTAPPKAPQQGSQGHLVTVGELSAFLAKNPSYQREQVQVEPTGYLRDWNGAKPPPRSRATDLASRVTGRLAKALCDSRGGLYPADGVPLSWPDNLRQYEYRLQSGVVVNRDYTGTIVVVNDKYAPPLTAIRCVR